MLGKTSISAIRALLLVAQQPPAAVLSPRRMAEVLGESPTYLAKVVRHLVKAAILEAERGTKGGVRLLLPANQITLLAVVEACQGTIVPDYCRAARPPQSFCGFHRAAEELHQAITMVLQKWTLSDLLRKTSAVEAGTGGVSCLMAQALQGMSGSGVPALVKLGKSIP